MPLRKPPRVAVIIDGKSLSKFAAEALNLLSVSDEISIFSCTNTRPSRRPIKHGLYYLLNFVAMRNAWSRSVPIDSINKKIDKFVAFESEVEGQWQAFPSSVLDELAEFDIILKFGMGLTRVPEPERLAVPILSYHHGDPDHFRGRPAGFWEIMQRRPVMGQIVQILSDRLDQGSVVAFAQTKVFAHSYKGTLSEAYRHSPLLINSAVRYALSGDFIPKESHGELFRLPSNLTVLRFAARLALGSLRRAAYGAFMEKKWQVSVASAEKLAADQLTMGEFPPAAQWRMFPIPRDYLFFADPFFVEQPRGLMVEALNRRTGLGEVVRISEQGQRSVLAETDHLSYPFTFQVDGQQMLLPERSKSGPPTCYRIDNGRLEPCLVLRLSGKERVLDPTLIQHEDRWYLFGNCRDVGDNVLLLWSADSLTGTFNPHPMNPIRISPYGARMAGDFRRLNGRLLRYGQDFSGHYGDGIWEFAIDALSPTEFSERVIGTLRFADRRGPHTMNIRGGEVAFDWYVHRFSPLAGLRRLRERRGPA
jgi:hypothetical protein